MIAWLALKGWYPMVSPTVRLFPQDRAAADRAPEAAQPPAVATLMSRLQEEFAAPAATQPAPGGAQIAFLSRATVLQAIGAAVVVGLWIAGLAGKPFEGN